MNRGIFQLSPPRSREGSEKLVLEDGGAVAIIGGGPAGSFFGYYLLDMAERVDMDIKVDIFEPRDFTRPGPFSCNMCGGIISETLVQTLAADGINLPPSVVQRGIDSYFLHTDVGEVRIETPLHERRIGAVHRGAGPQDIKELKWQSFDGHLQALTVEKGARLIQERVTDVDFQNGKPHIKTRSSFAKSYELIAVATGVNSATLKLFQGLGIGYKPPHTAKTFICEYYLGEDDIEKALGSSMHVFLLNIPRLEFAAIIPKGDYATFCLLGEGIDDNLVRSFLNSRVIKACMPSKWDSKRRSCQCSPRLSIRGAIQPFADRVVFIGDCGETRLYKDGIGAAYRTAKAAASTVIFQGISSNDFKRYFCPACKAIKNDNTIGKLSFFITGQIRKRRFARRALIRMTSQEQAMERSQRRMSLVMWDMFTGSAPYVEIFLRTLHPIFLVRFLWNAFISLFDFKRTQYSYD